MTRSRSSPNRTWAAAAVAAALVPLLAAAPSRAAGPEKIDCQGGPVTIAGDHRKVELADCSIVRVEGSHDEVTGSLTKRYRVFVTGDDNVVSLHPRDGLSYGHFKDAGKRNKVHGP